MKLHLPLSIRLAVISAMASCATVVAEPTQTPEYNKSRTTWTGVEVSYCGNTYPSESISIKNLTISNCPTVDFNNNTLTESTKSSKYGGALVIGQTGIITGNTAVSFTGNAVDREYKNSSGKPAGGGAIAITQNGGSVNIDGNESVTIASNSAKASGGTSGPSQVCGGAIYASAVNWKKGTFSICNNTEAVNFTGNSAVSKGYGPGAKGGAMYFDNYNLCIQNNASFVSSGNYECKITWAKETTDVQSTEYRLRSIYMLSNTPTEDDMLSPLIISAPEGGTVEFRDGIYAATVGAVRFGADYDGKAQSGDIILTGAYAEAALKELNPNYTEAELEAAVENSRTFEFVNWYIHPNLSYDDPNLEKYKGWLETAKAATLEGGRLIVQDAHYVGTGFHAQEGTLRLENSTFVHQINETRDSTNSNLSEPVVLDYQYNITFDSGTTWEAVGVNEVVAKDITMGENSTLKLIVTQANNEDNNQGEAVLKITADSFACEGECLLMKLDNQGNEELLKGGKYKLVTYSTEPTEESFDWNPENTIVKGLAKAKDISVEGDTVYLTYNRPDAKVLVWTNDEGNGLWDGESYNWENVPDQTGSNDAEDNIYSYKKTGSDITVVFDDCNDREIEIVGEQKAKKVLLDSKDAFTLAGGSIETNEFEIIGNNHNIATELNITDGGIITLNDGNMLNVTGSLTLGKGVQLVLKGEGYTDGSTVVSWTGDMVGNIDDLVLVFDGNYALEMQDNTIVLKLLFEQDVADTLAQGNWGIVAASRAFAGAIQGQRNNMGCIANGRGTAWVAMLGGSTDISGSGAAAGSDISLIGGAVGVDMKVGANSSLGVAFGYTDGEVAIDNGGKVDQETSHIGIYGQHGLMAFSGNSALCLDWLLAAGTTESEYKGSDWEQNSMQLNTRLTWTKDVTRHFAYSVFGGLEYFASDSDSVGTCKTGSVQNLRAEVGVGVRYVAVGSIQTVTDEKSGVTSTTYGCERVVLHGNVRYLNDLVRHNPKVMSNGMTGHVANPGRQGIGIEAGATFRMGENWSSSVNYGFNAMDDSDEHILNIGVSRTF